MISIAVTGGIGSGKSYVCKMLEQLGVPMYDADSQAKQLTLTDNSIRTQLIELLGPDVYVNGQLNKKLMADYLFEDSAHAATINAIIHPRVKSHFASWLKQHDAYDIAGLECAILFESGFDDTVEVVLTVSAPEQIRLQRAMKRDGATEAQIRARMAMQLPEREKEKRSQFIINNDGVVPLLPQLERIIESLKEENQRKICDSHR